MMLYKSPQDRHYGYTPEHNLESITGQNPFLNVATIPAASETDVIRFPFILLWKVIFG